MRKVLILTTLAAAAALPAAGQVYGGDRDGPYVDEVIVQPYGPYRSGPDRMSQRVGLSDLDLTTRDGQQVMRMRVRAAARDVCRALGEGPDNGSGVVPSCEVQAFRETRTQMRYAVGTAYRDAAYAVNDRYGRY